MRRTNADKTGKRRANTGWCYPHLWRWVNDFGTIEIGQCPHTRSFIRILDQGGMIWNGRRRCRSHDAALVDAEAGVARWMKDELGITDAA